MTAPDLKHTMPPEMSCAFTKSDSFRGAREASATILYKVDVSRDGQNRRVSSEWFSRPDDERYLFLSELSASVKGRAQRSRTRTVESAAIHVEAHRDDPEKLALVLPDAEAPVAPTHWGFCQPASLVGAQAAYLRRLPAPLAASNLLYARVLAKGLGQGAVRSYITHLLIMSTAGVLIIGERMGAWAHGISQD